MKKAILPLVILTSLLASCGSNTQAGISDTQNQTAIPQAASYAPTEAAKYFIATGVSKDRLAEIKNDLQSTKNILEKQNNDKIEAQSLKPTLQEIDTMLQALDIAKEAPQNLQSLALSRQLLVQATNNIALNSMSNYEYHLANKTYGNVLDYKTDFCSAPQFLKGGNVIFKRACAEHDFGYRNGSFWEETHTSSFKGAVDANFNSNMYVICRETWGTSGANYNACVAEAAVYFSGVKLVAVCPDILNNGKICWKSNYKYGDWF